VHWMYTLYRTRQGRDADDTPSLPEITAFSENPLAWVVLRANSCNFRFVKTWFYCSDQMWD